MDLATARKIMTQNNAYRNSMMQEPFGGMLTEEDYNSPIFTEAAAKKGGRIMKTKKGGRAVRKANRSKKK